MFSMVVFIFHMACSFGSSIPEEEKDSLHDIQHRLALVRELLAKNGFNEHNYLQEVIMLMVTNIGMKLS